MKFLVFNFIFILLFLEAYSQDSLKTVNHNSYVIQKIIFEGNKRTKEKIIRRELKYQENDTIPALKLDSILLWERNKVFNTNLFVTVDVKLVRIDSISNFVDLKIFVREQWYTVPQLVFDVPNNNYNYFFYELKGDLSKANFGAKLFQRNCFGRNQTLRLTLQAGFTRNIDVSYEIPYINKKQTLGLIAYTSISNNRNLNFATVDNKWKSLDSSSYGDFRYLKNQVNKESFRVGFGINYRPAFFASHFFEIAYYHNDIRDTIAKINPEFYLNGQSKQRYFYLHYAYNDDRRDVRQFALKGYVTRIDVEQLGLTPLETQNITRLTGTHARYYPLTKRFSYAGRVKVKLSFPDIQPFVDFRALGGGQDLVRGYDIYQIDGQHSFLMRNSLRFKVFSKLFNLGKLMFVRQFRFIPVDMYVSLFSDFGYVVNNSKISTEKFNNQIFSNKPLGSIGLGLNIVTFYNSVFRLEYSINGANYHKIGFNIFADI